MMSDTASLFAKKIKKQIYGKRQAVSITFPTGFSETAFNEVNTILNHPWFAEPFSGECLLAKNEIRIHNIHMVAIFELLIRSYCLTDIRLILTEGHASGKKAFEKRCSGIPWRYYIDETFALKLKVDSIESHAFHETDLKNRLADILEEFTPHIVSGESAQETTCIYATLYKDRLTVSISLAGDPLYKRGYRSEMSNSAPLREDIAACCIQKALAFFDMTPTSIIIPFSGTGTFAFEYTEHALSFSPALFNRHYALEKMPLFNKKTFSYLLKKAKEQRRITQPLKITCLDHSDHANDALLKNKIAFDHALTTHDFTLPELTPNKADFFNFDFSKLNTLGNLFIPLNPPYGIRLGKTADTTDLYKKIAQTLNKLAQQTQHKILGLILCPSEQAWSTFCKTITHSKMETYHFMQGGLDIRVCQWLS